MCPGRAVLREIEAHPPCALRVLLRQAVQLLTAGVDGARDGKVVCRFSEAGEMAIEVRVMALFEAQGFKQAAGCLRGICRRHEKTRFQHGFGVFVMGG